VDRESRRERAAVLRAGLVASAVYNVHRGKNQRPIHPNDFLRDETKQSVRILPPEQMVSTMDQWMRQVNRILPRRTA
jgi:hypothetical protein